MPLTLTLRSGPTSVPPLRLDGRGGIIGRAPEADWVLPDPRSLVSSRHAEILHRDGAYAIVDRSTNGTGVNGHRLSAPHRLAEGDEIALGDYRAVVSLRADASARPMPPSRPAGATAVAAGGAGMALLAKGAGIDPARLRGDEGQLLAAAGGLLRRFVEMVRAQEAQRRRARAEIGAKEVTPPGAVAAAPTVEEALLLMLSVHGDPAGATRLLDAMAAQEEAHRLAVLAAMQGSLRAALDRLSPKAIRARAKGNEAALWRAYEAGFGQEADFVERFATDYAQAYAERTAKT